MIDLVTFYENMSLLSMGREKDLNYEILYVFFLIDYQNFNMNNS